MERRQFGTTDMHVSVLGIGTSEIGYERTDQAVVTQMLNHALDNGLNVIDTAECYLESESLIGEAVSHRRKDYYLFTKCGHSFGVETGLPDWHPDQISQSIDHSLKRLKTDYLDLIQLHSCGRDVLEQGDVVDRLHRAREQGKTRYIGYSGDGETARFALELGVFDSLQTSVNIADQQSISLLLPYCVDHGVGVIAKRPVANVAWRNWPEPPDSGYAKPYFDRLQKLAYPFIGESLGESVGFALRFTLTQAGVCTAIAGTSKPHRWDANARAVADGPLDGEEISEIFARWTEASEPDWVGLN
ncbi:MAG: aldo/keto reductase [Chlorobia bacterium]|nr:aldo/keto reductase [Fimbriimonadaceae bacterium]